MKGKVIMINNIFNTQSQGQNTQNHTDSEEDLYINFAWEISSLDRCFEVDKMNIDKLMDFYDKHYPLSDLPAIHHFKKALENIFKEFSNSEMFKDYVSEEDKPMVNFFNSIVRKYNLSNINQLISRISESLTAYDALDDIKNATWCF